MGHERKPVRRVTEDTFAALIRLFKLSAKWTEPPPRGYTASTKETWGRELDFIARPACLGAVTLQEIRPSLVQAYFDAISDRPGKQHAGLSVLKQLEKWAIVRELLPRQITLGVEIGHSDGGHIPWTEEQVHLAEQHSTVAMAITLCANTGQRGSDLIRMGWTDLETYQGIEGINVVQQKTRKAVWIPITSALAATMKAWPRRFGPFLLRPTGREWTRRALTNAWAADRDSNPQLEQHRSPPQRRRDPTLANCDPDGLVLHGLRATACVRLRQSGATESQIADMVGMSIDMVQRYCRLAAQRENAVAAVLHLEKTFAERMREKAAKNPH